MAEEIEKLHPIIDEVSKTFTQLYEHRKDEATRQKLIKLERLLEEKLEKLREVREKVEKD